jgi:hypothetical protein
MTPILSLSIATPRSGAGDFLSFYTFVLCLQSGIASDFAHIVLMLPTDNRLMRAPEINDLFEQERPTRLLPVKLRKMGI